MIQRNILLIDDDADDQLIFTDALNELSSEFKCIVVKTGIEALSLLKTSATLPFIIFLDLNMPFMNGFEFLGKIKRDNSLNQLPVVILTTSNSPVDRTLAENLGAAMFLTKTADFKFLKIQLGAILETDFSKPQQVL